MLKEKRLRKVISAVCAAVIGTASLALFPVRANDTETGEIEVPDFSWLGAVGSLTSSQTQMAAEAIYRALAVGGDTATLDIDHPKKTIPANTDNFNSLRDVYVTVVGGYDVGILAIKNQLNISFAPSGDVQSIAINYVVPEEEYWQEYENAIAVLDTISAGVDPNWSAPEKALYLHEYIAVHYDYDQFCGEYDTDEEEYLCHTAYGMIKRGASVCEGYTWLYNILLEREGIEALALRAPDMGHTWNVLHIGDFWYHVDVTWDDSNDGHAGFVLHNSFLRNTGAMIGSGHTDPENWVLTTGQPASELPESMQFNSCFWTDSNAAIYPYDNGWLAITVNRTSSTGGWFDHVQFDAESGAADVTHIHSDDLGWPLTPGSRRIMSGTYIVSAVADDVIFYTSPTALYAFCEDEVIWLYDLTEEQKELGYLYGLHTDNDTLYYDVAETVRGDNIRFSLSLDECFATIDDVLASQGKSRGGIPRATTPVTAETTTMTETTVTSTETTTSAAETTATEPVSSDTVTTAPENTTAPTESTTTTAFTPYVSDQLPGDMNEDGGITIMDVLFLNKYLLGQHRLNDRVILCADVNGDGEIDIFDLGRLRQLLLQTLGDAQPIEPAETTTTDTVATTESTTTETTASDTAASESETTTSAETTTASETEAAAETTTVQTAKSTKAAA